MPGPPPGVVLPGTAVGGVPGAAGFLPGDGSGATPGGVVGVTGGGSPGGVTGGGGTGLFGTAGGAGAFGLVGVGGADCCLLCFACLVCFDFAVALGAMTHSINAIAPARSIGFW